MKIKILSWNVRGVNDSNKRKVIKNLIRTNRVDLVCLQETKVQDMNIEIVRSLEVGRFLKWIALNAEGSAGGILLFWDKRRINMVDYMVRSFSVSCLFKMVEDGFQWAFTNDVQNLKTLYQRKAQETRNTTVPLPWSKSCCGGRKTRSHRRPNLFSLYLSNDEESKENDHVNEFRGSKNGGREVWVDLEWPENNKIR